MSVFDQLVGQKALVDSLIAAAHAARSGESSGAMTHSWLFTGPPGSGRSVAAVCFAAALQCTDPGQPGCGMCRACATTIAGTHADVRRIMPEGLSIATADMRKIVQVAARRPNTGNWQVVVLEDADRLTEAAANVLLKMVEEPPARTVFLLCAPTLDPADISVTLRSRCRTVHTVTPTAEAIAAVLHQRDGVDPKTAAWAASLSGGHVGRARRLASDTSAAQRRREALSLAADTFDPSAAYAAADRLVAVANQEAQSLSAEKDQSEREELSTALGAGGTGRGTARATRGSAGALKDLERRQKSRTTRATRDALDRALLDIAGLYRDALVIQWGAEQSVPLNHPDFHGKTRQLATRIGPTGLVRSIQAVLDCRAALDANVKPRFALAAMVATTLAQTTPHQAVPS